MRPSQNFEECPATFFEILISRFGERQRQCRFILNPQAMLNYVCRLVAKIPAGRGGERRAGRQPVNEVSEVS
jgi:hypothetical protein